MKPWFDRFDLFFVALKPTGKTMFVLVKTLKNEGRIPGKVQSMYFFGLKWPLKRHGESQGQESCKTVLSAARKEKPSTVRRAASTASTASAKRPPLSWLKLSRQHP